MFPLVTEEDIKNFFQPMYYLELPMGYVKEVAIVYKDNTTRRYTPQQIRNKYKNNRDTLKLADIYEDEKIQMTEVEVNFKKLANEINNMTLNTFKEHIRNKKGG